MWHMLLLDISLTTVNSVSSLAFWSKLNSTLLQENMCFENKRSLVNRKEK